MVEETELIPFTYRAGRSALFPGKIKDLGLIPKSIVLEREDGSLRLRKRRWIKGIDLLFLLISNKGIDLLFAPPLKKRLRSNGWQRVRSTRSTGVIQ